MPLRIHFGDITEEKVDVIVNPTDHWYSGGGGTDYAVHQAAGYELETELEELPTLCTGDVSVTDAYDLQARYIFHTVGPRWKGGHHHEATLLRSCYTSALMKAVELDCHSIAFPLIASGTFRFPSDYASSIAIETISNFLKLAPELEVHLVIYPKGPAIDLFEDLGEYIAKHFTGHFLPQQEEEEDFGSYPAAGSRSPGYALPPEAFQTSSKRKASRTASPKPYSGSRKVEEKRNASPSIPMGACLEESVATILKDEEEQIPGISSKKSFKEDLSLTGQSQKQSKAKEVPLPKGWKPGDSIPKLEDGLVAVLLKYVNRYLDEHPEEKESTIYKRALLTRAHYSKIKSEQIQPRKYTILALAVALRLELAEIDELLLSAGYALSFSSIGDLTVRFYVEQKIYDIHVINAALLSYDAPLLGVAK